MIYAAALVAVVLLRNVAVTLVVLLPAGMAWIAVLSSVNAALQLFLPGWVRARGLSVYQTVLFGAQAAGAAGWGVVAGAAGLVPAFLAAAIMMAAGAATIRFWPFLDTAGMDRSPAVYWPDPQLVVDADSVAGPVVVQNTYTVAAAREQPFLQAMVQVRRSRLRTGAIQVGPVPGRRESAGVRRAVRGAILGRAPEAALGPPDRHRPAVRGGGEEAVRPAGHDRAPDRRRRPGLANGIVCV